MAAAIVYTLAGFLLVPYLLKRQIIDDLSERTGGTVTLGQLSVNPFLLSADLLHINIDAPAQQAFFTLGSLHTRFDIASLWRRGWVIREMVVDTPYLRLAALPQWSEKSDSLPVVSIAHLQVRGGRLQWTKAAPGNPAEAPIDLTELEFSLEKLGGEPYKPGQFTLAAVLNRTAWLRSSGSLRPFPGSLDATLELGGFNLADLDSMMAVGSGSARHMKILAGQLSATFNVSFADGQTSIRGQAGLDQLELADRLTGAGILSATGAQATEVEILGAPLRASVGVIQLNQPHLRLARNTDGILVGGDWLNPLFDAPTRLQPAIPRIEIKDGLLELTDQSLAPSYQIETDHVDGIITRRDKSTTVSVSGRVMGGSRSVLNADWLPTGSEGDGRLEIRLGNLDAGVLSPYLEAVAGRGIASGKLDVRFDYQASDQQFKLTNEITALGFQLDEVPASPVSGRRPMRLPLDLAVALVRDNSDRINISIPLPAGRVDNNTQFGRMVSEGFMNLVQNHTRRPFYTLGKLSGTSPRYLERIVFRPGDAALSKAAERNLAIISSALRQRPGLALKINGRFDTVVDRQALARKQVGLHVALASSSGPPGRAAPASIDFDDSKVTAVLDEFAGKRLSAAELDALRANYPQGQRAFYAAVFEALVKNEGVSRTKLKALARYRAQTIVNQLKAVGIEPGRLQVGKEIETFVEDAQMVFVKLEIALM